MKTRTDKINEIENLIEKNKFSRREFIDSLGKTVALSSIVAIGLASFFSCVSEDILSKGYNCQCSPGAIFGGFKCVCPGGSFSGYDCPLPFGCPTKNTCIPVNCKNEIDKYNCTRDVSHKGGVLS